MSQRELDQAVAEATGESLREIRRRGFSIVQPLPDDEPEIYALPQTVDWDALDWRRSSAAA
jgi:hypothetical protein